MSVSFVKLFTTITDSSVWDLPDNVCKIWITMLAMANSRGNVHAAITGIANRARKSVAEVEEALRIFTAPDPYSRTKDHDGRRIEPIDGGWRIINYVKHRRALAAEAVRESKREWAERSRELQRESANSNGSSAEVENRRSASNSCSVSLSGSDLDLDPERPDQITARDRHAPTDAVIVVDPKRGRFAPDDFAPTDAHRVRCQELGFSVDDLVREFKLFEFNREYSDWPKRFSRWIEDQRLRAETERGKANSGAGKAPSGAFARSARNPLGWQPNAKHEAIARKYNIDVQRYSRAYIDAGALLKFTVLEADEDFAKRLILVARGKPFGFGVAA